MTIEDNIIRDINMIAQLFGLSTATSAATSNLYQGASGLLYADVIRVQVQDIVDDIDFDNLVIDPLTTAIYTPLNSWLIANIGVDFKTWLAGEIGTLPIMDTIATWLQNNMNDLIADLSYDTFESIWQAIRTQVMSAIKVGLNSISAKLREEF